MKSNVRATEPTINLLESTMLWVFSTFDSRYDFSRTRVFFPLRITWRARYLQLTCVALISLLFCESTARKKTSWKIAVARGKSGTNKRTNHQRRDLLAAIRNHSSFGPGLNATHVNYWRERTSFGWDFSIESIAFYLDNFIELAFEEIVVNRDDCHKLYPNTQTRSLWRIFGGRNFNQFFL